MEIERNDRSRATIADRLFKRKEERLQEEAAESLRSGRGEKMARKSSFSVRKCMSFRELVKSESTRLILGRTKKVVLFVPREAKHETV